MLRRLTGIALAALVGLLPCSVNAQAQDLVSVAGRYREQEVRITTGAGESASGLLASIDAAAITLTTDSGTQQLGNADVVRLERRGDSNRDGFIKGVLVAIPWSLLALQGYDDKGAWARDSAIGTLLFGGIGAGIDAMRTGWTTVYDANASPPGRSASRRIAPGWGGAASVSVRF